MAARARPNVRRVTERYLTGSWATCRSETGSLAGSAAGRQVAAGSANVEVRSHVVLVRCPVEPHFGGEEPSTARTDVLAERDGPGRAERRPHARPLAVLGGAERGARHARA